MAPVNPHGVVKEAKMQTMMPYAIVRRRASTVARLGVARATIDAAISDELTALLATRERSSTVGPRH